MVEINIWMIKTELWMLLKMYETLKCLLLQAILIYFFFILYIFFRILNYGIKKNYLVEK